MSGQSSEGAEFAQHYRHQVSALASRWRLVAGAAALGALLGCLVWALLPTTYTAHADVLVRSISAKPFESTDVSTSLSMQTEIEIAESEPVAKKVLPNAASDALTELQKGLRVTNPPETAILRFSYTSTGREASARRASQFANSYLEDRAERTQATVRRTTESLTGEVQKLNKMHSVLEDQIRKAKRPQADILNVQRTLLETSIASAQNQLVEMRSIDTSPGDIVRSAAVPRFPDGPGLPVWLVIGTLLGAVGGMVLAWAATMLLGRVSTAYEVQLDLEAPVLATIPRRPRGFGRVFSRRTDSQTQEAYRKAAVRLWFMPSQARARTLLVVSASPGTTISSVATGLAGALAEAGGTVAIVEADLREPSLAQELVLDDADRARVAEWESAGTWPPSGQLAPLQPAGLVAVPGVKTFPPIDALTSPLAEKIFTRLGEETDFTIVCAPPILDFSDALAILPLVDAVLLVCDLNRTSHEELRSARDLVVSTGGTVLGAVATRR